MKKATNSALMRIKNEKIILSLINKNPVSRADIAKKTGLTKAAVTIIVDDLKQRNIVFEKIGQSNSVGRNPVMLYMNDKAFYIIGVNITRRNIHIGITDLSGNVISKESFLTCPPDTAFEKIKESVESQILKTGIEKSEIYKLAIVTPGPVDTEGGLILNPPNFNEWHNVSIVEEIKSITGFNVVFDNVSSATAVAEKYFGSAKETENFMTLQVDEGVGTGIVIRDMLFKGPCEFGHISIKFDGEKCECGNRGCLEKYASIPQILKNTNFKSWQEVIDDNCIEILEMESEYLSTAVVSANNIFNFEKIVLCGDLTYKPEKIINLISEKNKKKILNKSEFKVCAGQVKSKTLQAAAIAVYDFFG